MGDDPPYLMVGTEVSAKYRGAFCEAKIRKVVRIVKCKVTYKGGGGTTTLSDDNIKGDLRVGAVVEAKSGDKTAEATINKIQDCSQYTVVFDDGDITTLRRSALCLKSGRHFNESETLDQLPLTHPEHFSNPVVGGRRGARRRIQNNEEENESSEDEEAEASKKGRTKLAKEVNMGKIVVVESSEKKKGKDSWFPGLVVSPSAQETVKIRVKDEYLVRSFKDGRYYTVPKKETTEFTKDSATKAEHASGLLRTACEKAIMFMDKNELPPHWDRDVLFGVGTSSTSEDAVSESEMSEDDPREEKDRFVAQLYKFMDERQTPINKVPTVSGRDLDLYKLYKIITSKGGYNKVTNASQWKPVAIKLGFAPAPSTATVNLVKQAYKKFLHNFEEINRKLGCSLSSLSQGSSAGKSRSNRTLIRGTGPSKEERKEQQHVKVELEFESVSADEEPEPEPEPEPGSEQGDTESVASEQSKGRDASVERLLELPRRARSRQENRGLKKEPEDDKSDKGTGKLKRLSKKKDSVTEVVKEINREGATTPVSAGSPVPSTGSAKRGSTRGKPPKKELDLESEDSPDHVGKHVKVTVGDKLQVYYGPKSKGNVTYEAKVIEARVTSAIPEFLVHYNGWNSRYDEWITRNRIAKVISHGKLDDDQDNSDNKSTPKGTGKRKGSKVFSGNAPFRKGSLKSNKAKEDQSSGSDGETSDSEMKPVISIPPSSVGPPVSLKPSRARKLAQDDDDASSVASSASSVPTTGKGKRGSLGDIKAKLEAGSSSPEVKQGEKGNETPKPDKSSNLPPGEVKLDIYDFDDDLGDADVLSTGPNLKIYSPRSPDKKDEVPVKSPEDKTVKEEPGTGTVAKEPLPAKAEHQPVRKEKPEPAEKEAKTPKVKKEPKTKSALSLETPGKSPQMRKKSAAKVWNPAVSTAATTLPVAAVVKSAPSLSSQPLSLAGVKTGASKQASGMQPKSRNFLQVTAVTSTLTHGSSILSTAGQPVKLLPKPRPPHAVSGPMVNTAVQRVTLTPSTVSGVIRNFEPQSSLTISQVSSPSVLIRPAASVSETKPLYHSPATGAMVSASSLGLATASATPITVVTPSGQIFHPTQQQASIGMVGSSGPSTTVTTSSLTMTSVPSISSNTNVLATPEKKSPSKRKLAQDDRSLNPTPGSPYLSKIDPTHLPPKKKVKKVITKNIIDLRPDETGKMPLAAESPEKKPRKPAKKRIKQDGLMDLDRPFPKSPSKSPKKKKLDTISAVTTDKLKITTGSPIFTTSSATITSSVPHMGSSNLSADYHTTSSPLELHLTGTMRPESTGTIPKIDVKVVKCSTLPSNLLPDSYSSQMEQAQGSRYSNEGMSMDETVPIARMFPPQSPSASYEYITLQASTPEKNDGSPSPVTILASSTPALRPAQSLQAIDDSLSFTNKIITEALADTKPITVLPLRSEGSSGKSSSPVMTTSSVSVVKTEVKEESTGVMSISKSDETTTTKVNVVSIKVTSERQVSSEVLPIEDANSSIPIASIKDMELDDQLSGLSAVVKDEESCHSLLCEEEIPGSPPPGADSMFGLDDDSRANSPAPPKFSPLASKSSSEESHFKELNFTSKLDELAEAGMQAQAKEEAAKSGASGRSGGYGGKNQDRFGQRGPGERMPLGGFDRRAGESGLHNMMDNTPPTTPESSSLSSGSPRVDNGRISPSNDLQGSGKSKDSSDVDSLKLNEEESSNDAGRKSSKDGKKVDSERWSSRAISPPGKRKRVPRRRSPDEVVKSYGTYRGRGGNTPRKGDREETAKPVPAPPPINLVKPPMSKKFNLIPDLDDEMESEQRVQVLQQALQSIRDKYLEIRQELSSEERRLKRYKRRQKEREKEKTKHTQKASA